MAAVSPRAHACSSTLARPAPYTPSDWPAPCGAVYASARPAGGGLRSSACSRCRESSRDVAVTFGVHILFVFVVYLVPATEIDDLMEAHYMYVKKDKGMFLYGAVSSLLDRSKHSTLHALADLFIPTPTRLLREAF